MSADQVMRRGPDQTGADEQEDEPVCSRLQECTLALGRAKVAVAKTIQEERQLDITLGRVKSRLDRCEATLAHLGGDTVSDSAITLAAERTSCLKAIEEYRQQRDALRTTVTGLVSDVVAQEVRLVALRQASLVISARRAAVEADLQLLDLEQAIRELSGGDEKLDPAEVKSRVSAIRRKLADLEAWADERLRKPCDQAATEPNDSSD